MTQTKTKEVEATEKGFRETTPEMRLKRGKSLAAMQAVTQCSNGGFAIKMPTLRGNTLTYYVKRDEAQRVVCSCGEFDYFKADTSFRCEHIIAVKEYLLALNAPGTPANPPVKEKAVKTPVPAQSESVLTQPPTEKQQAAKESMQKSKYGFHINKKLAETQKTIEIDCHGKSAIRTGVIVINSFLNSPDEGNSKEYALAQRICDFLNGANPNGASEDRLPASVQPQQQPKKEDPHNPGEMKATTLKNMLSMPQLNLIRNLCKDRGLDPDKTCYELYTLNSDELSMKGAGIFITHLQTIPKA